ncbi:MAG TPA: acetate--CoA ligase family protein, partial [Frankiaceae bacterium]|nr:acetate--CoA ligase family protein [Frankiaceae bacterium]
ASRTRGAVGDVVLRHLLAGGFAGPVYPVNPAAVAVASVRAYPSVLDVPDEVDLAVVCTPPAVVPQVVEQCGRKGVRGLVVLTDMGPGEATRSLVTAARAHGMRVVGPAGLGIVDLATGLNASLASRLPPPGRVGCYSQSGPLGFALLSAAAERGLGMSSFVSAGNRADVSGNDLLQYWEDDEGTDVVLMHLETFGNPRKFARLARRVGRTTPVVVVKSSRSPLDDALLRQAGVIRVDRVSQGFDVAALLVGQPLPRGRRVAVVGDAPALVGLTVRACEAAGLVPDPVMLDAGSSPENYEGAFLRAAEGRDAVVSAVVPPFSSDWRALAAAVSSAAARSGTPVVATVLGSEPVPAELAPVPAYPSPEGAVAALARAVTYAWWRTTPPGTVPAVPVDRGAARAAVRAPGPLDPSGAARLLAAYGIPVVPAVPVRSPDEAVETAERLGWPVALKARAPEHRYRPDLGAVRLDLAGEPELRSAWAAVTARLGDGPYVLQAMAPPGVPLVVGSVEDPTYGPLVSFGVAGVATDLLGDRAYHILPLTDADATRLV